MPPALDVRLRGAGRRAETPGSQRKDAAFRWLELLAMSRRASAQSTLRAAGEHRAPELGQGAGRSGRAPRMGTVRLGHRGTKPQPTPRPLRTPSLVAAPPPPPQPSAVRSRTRPRKPPQAIQPSAAPLDGRRHCPACCGRGLVTPRPHSLSLPSYEYYAPLLAPPLRASWRVPGVTLTYGWRRGSEGTPAVVPAGSALVALTTFISLPFFFLSFLTKSQ